MFCYIKKKYSSSVTSATFLMVDSHMCLMVTILGGQQTHQIQNISTITGNSGRIVMEEVWDWVTEIGRGVMF